MEKINVCICGGGNGAHALAGLAAERPDIIVRVLTLYDGEAERWSDSLKEKRLKTTGRLPDGTLLHYENRPEVVTSDPKVAVKGADIIIFIVPANAHDVYFQAILPHLSQDVGTTIVGIPSEAGFEFAARAFLEDKAKHYTIMAFESLPWACRIQSYGTHVHILGFKDTLVGGIQRGDIEPKFEPVAALQKVLGDKPQIEMRGHLLGITLISGNAYTHPVIMYGQWEKNWHAEPLNEPPLFYHGVDEYTAELLSEVSAEVVLTAKAIMDLYPQVDLSVVRSEYQCHLDMYGTQIKDKSNLRSCLRTNPSYEGLTHPCVKTEDGKFVPDYKHRYFTEDIPFGLVVLKGIAEIVGLKTPNIDLVLSWSQGKMNKEYLVNGKLVGKDMKETRAPQVYQVKTVEQLLGF